MNALNRGQEDNSTISMPEFEAIEDDDEATTRDPDYQFYLAYDFYDKDNPTFHRKNLYGFKQSKKFDIFLYKICIIIVCN